MIACRWRAALLGVRRALRGDRGSVTVEAAFGIASIVTVVLLVVAGAGACLTQMRLESTVREAARLAAIDGISAGLAAGREIAPDRAELSLTGDDIIHAEATMGVGGMPGVRLTARASVRAEPGRGE